MALTVLIVEDEQSASRLLSAIAAEVGLSARTTGSAREAQELCDQGHSSGQPFSAVVLDLVLSELDGFQFAKAARAASWGKDLPLIVVSGIYKKLPEEFAASVRPAAFFAKPFEPPSHASAEPRARPRRWKARSRRALPLRCWCSSCGTRPPACSRSRTTPRSGSSPSSRAWCDSRSRTSAPRRWARPRSPPG